MSRDSCWRYTVLDASLICTVLLGVMIGLAVAQEEGDVRLSGGLHALQGFLEVFTNGDWGTVCSDKHWDEDDAKVVCRQIGAIGGVMFPKSPHMFTEVDQELPVHMSKVKCVGNEEKLTDCSFQNRSDTCAHVKDVKMDCALPGFLACVVNDGQPPLTGRTHNPPGLNVDSCTKLCRQDGYHYAGVAPLTCFCGSAGEDFRRYGVAPNAECNTVCQGEGSQGCGAENRVAIHEVVVGSCSGTLKANEGVITSPGFPGSYPPNSLACQWVVDVSENGDTALWFSIFKVADEDEIHISVNNGKNWTIYRGSDYDQESSPSVGTFDEKSIMVQFIRAAAGELDGHAAFVLTFQDNTTCDVIEFPHGHMKVEDGAAYRPGDKVEVVCDKKYRSDYMYTTCNPDGLWYNAPECTEAPPRGPSLAFTQTYLFMMLAVMGALGVIFFMVICGVICAGRKKKQEGYTGISRQESAEPTKADNEYHIDMREGSDIDMQRVPGNEDQGIPLASGAADE